MNALVLLIATSALGIEAGWEPLPGGGHEYTIQIEPQLLEVLEKGNDEIFSEVPQGVEVRRYRIVVGVGKLPRNYGPLAGAGDAPVAAAPAVEQPVETPLAAEEPSFEPPAAEVTPPASEPDFAFGAPPTEPADDLEPLPPEEPPLAMDAGTEIPDATSAPDFSPAEPAAPDLADLPPDDPWATEPADEAQGSAGEMVIAPPDAIARDDSQPPAKLPPGEDDSAPIKAATFESGAPSGVVDTGKPELPDDVPQARPWGPLVTAIVLLMCSIGANIFLGWIAWDARNRYRSALTKFRGAAA